MTVILTLNEMFDALSHREHPMPPCFRRKLDRLGDAMARALAEDLEIVAGQTSTDHAALAGTACAFHPSSVGQPRPAVFIDLDLDTGGDWETLP